MIEIHNLSKSFGGQNVLNQISLRIADGTRLCLIGGSGSGKSVLLRCVLGLEQIDAGSIQLDGQEMWQAGSKHGAQALDQFGVVFQRSALFDSLSVRENIGIKLFETRQLEESEIEARIVEALQKVQLSPDILTRFPAELSGGMQKRVAIARAIVDRPRFLVYDEPTTGLDPVNADRIDELILELALEEGRTSIIVTHDMDSLRKIASQVVMIHEKNIGFEGSPEAFWDSDRPEVNAFLRRTLE
ncbi:MAG: ATP-binding cassette domain-containing protein [Bacteroidota bacterium]